MRIISGKYKGRTIKIPPGIRPTQGKVRKAVFDILGDLKGLSFLELFAGSGAVGLEALSAGAREVVFVEQDKSCAASIRENLSLWQRAGWRILCLRVISAIRYFKRKGEKFDIIFLDPPYYQDIPKKILQTLAGYDILAAYGLVMVQHYRQEILPKNIGDLRLIKQASYGDSWLTCYQKAGP